MSTRVFIHRPNAEKTWLGGHQTPVFPAFVDFLHATFASLRSTVFFFHILSSDSLFACFGHQMVDTIVDLFSYITSWLQHNSHEVRWVPLSMPQLADWGPSTMQTSRHIMSLFLCDSYPGIFTLVYLSKPVKLRPLQEYSNAKANRRLEKHDTVCSLNHALTTRAIT